MSAAPAHKAQSRGFPIRFGKYELLRRVGVGGMAEALLAYVTTGATDNQIVIKRILPQLMDNERVVGMFLDEARLVEQMSHPHICKIFELGVIEGQHFIAMEYLRGAPLAKLIATRHGRKPNARLLASLVRHGCEGLHYAHELRDANGEWLRVVHRDVSPQNLFVCGSGELKVLDFGVAKAASANTHTRTGSLKGKYAYMAPEQITGNPVDRRTDVFALGIVLHESLSGKRLFARGNDYEIFKAVLDDPIPSLAARRPDLPPGLVAVIDRCLERDPSRRPTSALELAEELASALRELGGTLPDAEIAEQLALEFPEYFQNEAMVPGEARAPSEPRRRAASQPPARPRSSFADALPTEISPSTHIPELDEGLPTRIEPVPSSPSQPVAPMHLDAAEPRLLMSPDEDARRPTTPARGLRVLPLAPPVEPTSPALAVARQAIRPRPTTAVAVDMTAAAILMQGPASRAASRRLAAVTPLPTHFSSIVPTTLSGSTPSLRPQRPAWFSVGLPAAAIIALAVLVWSTAMPGPQKAEAAPDTATTQRSSRAPLAQAAPAPATLPTPTAAAERKDTGASVDQGTAPDDEAHPVEVETPPVDENEAARAVVGATTPEAETEERAIPKVREATRRTRASRKLDPGTITIDSAPYATVYLGNRRLGDTPLLKVRVPAGSQRLRLKTADGRSKTVRVNVPAGDDAPAQRVRF